MSATNAGPRLLFADLLDSALTFVSAADVPLALELALGAAVSSALVLVAVRLACGDE